MRLKTVQIREFRSIWDSNSFDVGDITCLVGKNEAGKTALLEALHRLRPADGEPGEFDVTDDYPRVDVEEYRQDVEEERRRHAMVVRATFELDEEELARIAEEFGEGILEAPTVTLSKGYERHASGKCKLYVGVPVDPPSVARNALEAFALPEELAKECLRSADSIGGLQSFLDDWSEATDSKVKSLQAEAEALDSEGARAAKLEEARQLGPDESVEGLRERLQELAAHGDLGMHIWGEMLQPSCPRFLYFSSYDQLAGEANIAELLKRRVNGDLKRSDRPLLGLLELARIDLEQLQTTGRTEALMAKLESAGNHLSKRVLSFWSQNRHVRMKFSLLTGRPDDPEGMSSGLNIWARVEDTKRLAATGLGTRSAGFIWFFSFLAWYSSLKKKGEPLILLLDEPGLTLHGKAQADLLRYFDAEIAECPKHQVIYTTHSPFMVDSQRFDRVRIVQDRSIDSDVDLLREEDGTKVLKEVLDAGEDSLFPLQGALGYEIHQTLFVGPNSLIVEGVSDLLYLQVMSAVLAESGKVGLDERWTITPVGGSGKVPTFVSLLRSQENLNVATLIDFQKSDRGMLESLYKKKLLKKSHVRTYADFTGTTEADVEDMFDAGFYLKLVNSEYGSKIKVGELVGSSPRITVRLVELLKTRPLPKGAAFSHYRPARRFTEKSGSLTVSSKTIERFEQAFEALNALLPKS